MPSEGNKLRTRLRLPGAHIGIVLVKGAVAALCDGRQDFTLAGAQRLAIGNGQRDIPALADHVDALVHPLGKLLEVLDILRVDGIILHLKVVELVLGLFDLVARA